MNELGVAAWWAGREQQLFEAFHKHPEIMSLLYDLGRMPEQLERGTAKWVEMLNVMEHMARLAERLEQALVENAERAGREFGTILQVFGTYGVDASMTAAEAATHVGERLRAAEGELAALKTVRPLDQWHEDMGDQLWWCFVDRGDGPRPEEAPYSGSPLDSDWPGYHTHFSPLVLPVVP